MTRCKLHRVVPVTAHRRLLIAVVASALTSVLTPQLRPTLRLLLAWDVGTWTLIALAWLVLVTSDAAETRKRAAAEDPGRLFVHLVVLLSTMFSLVAAVALLRERAAAHAGHEMLWWLVSLGAVTGAWLLNHTSWALRYAHLYYREDREGVGGLIFPGELPPDDMDFAYFSFTLGICMQTSDVTITGRQLRRAALLHAGQSFAFNTTIIALMLNVVFGLLSG
jgi:uncharacterized membrane protein